MRNIVIMPGGFHPFHAGHAALYQSAVKAFNDADTYVAATNDTKTRPFPFAVKEKLAKLAGVADKHFVQVKSPFQPKEITDHYNPEEDVLIFVRSEKDKNESPKPGGTKKDGTPAYFQPWTGKDVQPFGKQAYIAYLPTVEFGPGITSATEIRNAWPTLNDKRKTAMVMSLYPVTQKNPKLAANVVKMLDMGMGNELSEGSLNEFVPPSSDRDDGGNDRNRRIRKLLEIAIQVAKEKNVDELGMIHAMNMIAGDEFFNTAVEGILPDITDKEYMFVLQSAYKTVKQGLAEGTTVTRIDSKPITDFLSSLKAYKHTDDWSQSGVDTGDDSYWKNKNLKTNTTKGLFAGDPRRTALYATGNAHETRYVEFTQDGQPIVYFDRKDLPAMRSRKTYLTVFDASDFRQLPTGEWFSENPSKPIKQVPIGDPFKYIASQGWIVRVTDDLDKVFKQVKNMHKAGKIAQYGAEGMNESKQGLAEGDVVPFKQPAKILTWKQVPKDVLLLANDWLWAEYDNTGLDAVMDPKGFGNGTANELQYITAKLQQKGWTIDHNDENDGPGEFNLRLTNNRGQTVLLSIEDAQTFTGWAKGTSSYPSLNEGPFVQRLGRPNKVNIYVRHTTGKPSLLIATDIPYSIYDKFIMKAMQKYPQFRQSDFSFKSADKLKEETKLSESADYLDEN